MNIFDLFDVDDKLFEILDDLYEFQCLNSKKFINDPQMIVDFQKIVAKVYKLTK